MMQSNRLRQVRSEVQENVFGFPEDGVVMMGTVNYGEDKNPFLPVILGREQDIVVLPNELESIYVPWSKHLERNGLGKSRVVFANGDGNLAQRLYNSGKIDTLLQGNDNMNILPFDNGDLTYDLLNNGHNLLDMNDETSRFVDEDPDMIVYAVQSGVRDGLGKLLQGVKVRSSNATYRDWHAKVPQSLDKYFTELNKFDSYRGNGEGLIMVNPYHITKPDENDCVVYEYVSLRRDGQSHFPGYVLDKLHRSASIQKVK